MRFIALGLFIFSICTVNASTKYFSIKSKEKVEIFIQNKNSGDLNNASKLLEKYLFEIVQAKASSQSNQKKGAKFILTENPSLHPDGFRIEIKANKLTIEGGIHKGSTYGVIYVLENYLGCKYLNPSYQIIPKKTEIHLPISSFEDQPVNDVRIINLYYVENEEYRDWLHLNAIDEIYPKGYFVHTFERLMPWETYFESQPDYFALVNGKRSIDQICPTNPKVHELIIAKLKAEMKLQPDKQKWSVSQNDNYSHCQCDKCKKIIEEEESPAGPIIHLVNTVAAEFPDKIISTLAYQYSRKAPKHIKPLKNVEVMLCSIELNRHASIEDNPACADFRKDVEDWGKICSNIFLWDYTINFDHSISPFPNLHILQPNVQFFSKNHVNALFEQSNSTLGYEFSELKVYLLSKLMWNPNIDFEQEKKTFCSAYYGDASPYILEFIQTLEQVLHETKSKLWIYEHPVVHQNGLFSEENLSKYAHIFDKAEEAVRADSIHLNHVRLARLPLQYATLEIAANNMFSERGWYQIIEGKTIPNKHLHTTLDRFEQTCLQNHVPTINESRLTPQEYVSSLRRLIDINIEGNLAFGKVVKASNQATKTYQQGDLSYLTNGVSGASDYNVHWLGWNGTDTELILDISDTTKASYIALNSLWNPKSWILHPANISCSVSLDGIHYFNLGTLSIEGNQQNEKTIRSYVFNNLAQSYRFVKFTITGTKTLYNWHPSAGQPSWFFIDEITVKEDVPKN